MLLLPYYLNITLSYCASFIHPSIHKIQHSISQGYSKALYIRTSSVPLSTHPLVHPLYPRPPPPPPASHPSLPLIPLSLHPSIPPSLHPSNRYPYTHTNTYLPTFPLFFPFSFFSPLVFSFPPSFLLFPSLPLSFASCNAKHNR